MLIAGMCPDRFKAIIPLSPAWMIPENARAGEMLGTTVDPLNIPDEFVQDEENVLSGNYIRVAQTFHVEDEIERYQVHIKKLLNDVEKIKDVKGYDDEMLIAPWSEDCLLRDDNETEPSNPKEVVERAPRHTGNYIEVPVVVGESEGA